MLSWLYFIIVLIALIILVASYSRAVQAGLIGRFGGADVVKDLAASPRTKAEQFSIDILEQITGKKFPTVNPDWLKFDGRTMELDGYCEEIALALEYNGPLHTKWYPNRESREAFERRQEKDRAKVEQCKKRGVDLIVVDSSLPRIHTRNYILSRLYDFGRTEFPPPTYIPAYAPAAET